MAELNPKQQAFVREYLIDKNATQAAIRAGYSAKTAGSQAHELLKKPEIQQAIQEALQALSQKTGVTLQAVIDELARLAFYNEMTGVVKVNEKIAALKELRDHFSTAKPDTSGDLDEALDHADSLAAGEEAGEVEGLP